VPLTRFHNVDEKHDYKEELQCLGIEPRSLLTSGHYITSESNHCIYCESYFSISHMEGQSQHKYLCQPLQQ
jgi:hypothetical protein